MKYKICYSIAYFHIMTNIIIKIILIKHWSPRLTKGKRVALLVFIIITYLLPILLFVIAIYTGLYCIHITCFHN